MRQLLKGILLLSGVLSLLTLLQTPVLGGEATLVWNSNTEADLAGYKIYYGISPRSGNCPSGGYPNSVDIGRVTTYTLTNLIDGQTYYFSLTAYDNSLNESCFSSEAAKTIAADTTAPVISSISSSAITSSGATISWTTNELSDTQIQYGTTTAYGSTTSRNTSMVITHSQSLTGLSPSTLFHFRVLSRDAAGNSAISGDNIFTTPSAPDSTAPAISGATSSNITLSGAVITWVTNEAATSQVEYGSTTAYGTLSALNTTPVTNHSRTLSGLTSLTLYHYRVISKDAAGNTSVSGDQTFTTASTTDITPPVIFSIDANNIIHTGATITWSTDEAATTQVEYGQTASYGSLSPLSSTLVTGHQQPLTDLAPSTLYHYRVRSADNKGNLSVSLDKTFVTSAAPEAFNRTPPQDVSGFSATGENGKIVLRWTNPSDSDFVGVRIRFRSDHFPDGIDDGELLGDFTGSPDENVGVAHESLQNGVTYYYIASSYDGQGNFQTTARASATPSAPSPGEDTESSSAGGCGIIDRPGGKPPGPAQAADIMLIVGTILFIFIKKRLQSQANRWTALRHFFGQRV